MKRWLLLLSLLFAVPALAASPPVILVLGDSLGASYGVPAGQGWVALLQQRLRAQGYPHRVVNASVSGDTTAGGLTRLPAALDREHPQIVLLELGGNDGLRGLPVPALKANLGALIERVENAHAQPVLFEMRVPPNYGQAYGDAYWHAFGEVAQARHVPLVPFFLLPIVTDAGAFQEDGIHPTAASQPKMLDAVWPVVKGVLDRQPQGSGTGQNSLRVDAPHPH